MFVEIHIKCPNPECRKWGHPKDLSTYVIEHDSGYKGRKQATAVGRMSLEDGSVYACIWCGHRMRFNLFHIDERAGVRDGTT